MAGQKTHTKIQDITDREVSGFGGLEVTCWPLELQFAVSNPAGFFRAKISSTRLPSEGK
jgi:hypothetical protein